MSQHLKFDAVNGVMSARSTFGKYTEDLLQLNDHTQVIFRKTTLHALKIAAKELISLQDQKAELFELLQNKKVSQAIYDNELKDINNDIELTETLIQNLSGTTPLPPLKKVRLGVVLS
ncbi:hypothetical protein [Pseudomonas sputi]|uniref:hypothetical protein n=1 Tax=Pseudomonas sputi TaxID=2892325 RepID=UPI001F2D6A32|nr:hypothetical protein [Pseudomonas sputi]